ncbi:hypothetical protein AK812_SmicGene16677 [Symbiodinium microadriaticum]|uniref:Uncharacterized protein n=1 Tax=Symbiodinium microadriaticum TaxID=2951 RepID=A0A1Q9DZQ3_SYMMI|nr:hypothetical protein AK812_SmicGene16677 [Symbiodinium microadriaticum]
MEDTAEPDYLSALPDVNPADTHHQGMSPNTASATAVADAQGPMQDAVMAAGRHGADGGVAVRTMAVAVATGQPGGTPNWQAVQASPTERVDAAGHMVGAVEHSFGQMNAAQASWNVVTSRRTAPVWIQRLGAFFHEMRNQQVTWPPSPMGSPPARQGSTQGSPEAEQRSRGSPALLSPEQQERLRRMEQRAPLLYGPPRGERMPEGNGSSGGSTYEAVQEEVKRQLRGVVSQLEASKREAQDLRHEVALLRAEREQAGANGQLEDMAMPEGPPVTLGGYLANQVRDGVATTANGGEQDVDGEYFVAVHGDDEDEDGDEDARAGDSAVAFDRSTCEAALEGLKGLQAFLAGVAGLLMAGCPGSPIGDRLVKSVHECLDLLEAEKHLYTLQLQPRFVGASPLNRDDSGVSPVDVQELLSDILTTPEMQSRAALGDPELCKVKDTLEEAIGAFEISPQESQAPPEARRYH